MDEEARDILYRQLVEMSELNLKKDAAPIIDREMFFNMPEEEVLKYVFDYRDAQTQFEVGGQKATYYIEMPNIYLHGIDLSQTYLSKFILSHEVAGNQREPSVVDLGDTKVTINLTDLGYSELTKGERERDEEVIDLEFTDFSGCNLYGLLPDEYQNEDVTGLKKKVVVLGRDRLDERYLKRREAHHLSAQEKKIADRAYERLLKGESFYRMAGNKGKIDLTDYDITEVEDLKNLCENFCDYDVEITPFTMEQAQKIMKHLHESKYREKLLEGMIHQGEFEFVKQNLDKIYTPEYVEQLLLEMVNHGETEFVKHNFAKVYHLEYKDLILRRMMKQGEMEFAKQKFELIYDQNVTKQLLEVMLTYDEIEFVNQSLAKISIAEYKTELQNQMASQLEKMYLQGNTENAERNFEKIDLYTKSIVIDRMWQAQKTESKINDETLDKMIISYINSEKNEKEVRGKKEVSSSGSLLYKVLSDREVDEELALKLIKLGSGLDYIGREDSHSATTYTPILYKAMQIEDDKVRKEIVEAMLEAGVNVEAERVKIVYEGGTTRKETEYCMKMRDGELRTYLQDEKILSSLRNKTANQEQMHSEPSNITSDNGFSVSEKLKKVYEQYGKDLKTISAEKLEIKEKILDICGANDESVSLDSYIQVALFNEDLLYARLMFFKEQKIKIDSKRFDKTIALTSRQFAEKYGERLGMNRRNSTDDIEHWRDVSKKLKEIYPLPKSSEELGRRLDELIAEKEVE